MNDEVRKWPANMNPVIEISKDPDDLTRMYYEFVVNQVSVHDHVVAMIPIALDSSILLIVQMTMPEKVNNAFGRRLAEKEHKQLSEPCEKCLSSVNGLVRAILLRGRASPEEKDLLKSFEECCNESVEKHFLGALRKIAMDVESWHAKKNIPIR